MRAAGNFPAAAFVVVLFGHLFADRWLWGGEEGSRDETADDCAKDGCDPEEPELTECPSANEDCGTSATRGVNRCVG